MVPGKLMHTSKTTFLLGTYYRASDLAQPAAGIARVHLDPPGTEGYAEPLNRKTSVSYNMMVFGKCLEKTSLKGLCAIHEGTQILLIFKNQNM